MDTTALSQAQDQSQDMPFPFAITAIKSGFYDLSRTCLWEHELVFPRCFVNTAKALVYERYKDNWLVFDQIKYITQAIIPVALLESVFTIVDDPQFFGVNLLTNKLVRLKDLDDEVLWTLLEDVCKGAYAEQGITDEIRQSLLPILSSILGELTQMSRFFEGKEERDEVVLRLVYDMRYMTREERWHINVRIKDKLQEGASIAEVARLFNVNRDTVSKVAHLLKKNPDLDPYELRERQRGPKSEPFGDIPQEVFFELVKVLTEKKTTDFEIPYATWCVKAVQLYLEKKHKIKVTCQKLYSILLKNEVTSKFAARSNFRMDPDKRDEFIHVGFAKICWRAFEEGRELLFGDETTTMRGFRRKGYALKGKRTYTAYSGSLQHANESKFTLASLEGAMYSYTVDGSFTTPKFIAKLRQLVNDNPGKKFLLVLDNCSVHKAKALKDFLNGLPGEPIVIEYLPEYCPDLNPVECINNALKGYIASKPALTLAETSAVADQFFWEIYDSDYPEEVVKKFFLGEGASYAVLQYMQVKKEFLSKQAA